MGSEYAQRVLKQAATDPQQFTKATAEVQLMVGSFQLCREIFFWFFIFYNFQ